MVVKSAVIYYPVHLAQLITFLKLSGNLADEFHGAPAHELTHGTRRTPSVSSMSSVVKTLVSHRAQVCARQVSSNRDARVECGASSTACGSSSTSSAIDFMASMKDPVLLGLALGRFNHERTEERSAEKPSLGMEAIVDQAFGEVHRLDASSLAAYREDNFVHAGSGMGRSYTPLRGPCECSSR
jgi:hypothetical protein